MTAATLDTSESRLMAHTRLLRRLHELFQADRGDSEEADSIREEMGAHWYAMSEQERERMSGLSEDLYALGESTVRAVQMNTAEREEWSHDGAKAFAERDFDRALMLLRKPPSDMPQPMVWFLQARCWARLGDLETALVFMSAAAAKDRGFAVFQLSLLEQLRHDEQATNLARSLIDDPQSDYLDLYSSAGTILSQLEELSEQERIRNLRHLVAALTKALEQVRLIPINERPVPRVESYIVCMLAHCLYLLEEPQRAQEVYETTLQRNPADAEVLTCRGIERLEGNHELALSDFRKAVKVGTASVWPYLILAKDALSRGQFYECHSLAQAGLVRTKDPELLAELYEAAGISRAELGWIPASVIECFEKALEHTPNNERIRKNFEVAILNLASPSMRNRLIIKDRLDRMPRATQIFTAHISEISRSRDLVVA